jgi:ComF family protein
MPVSIVHRLLDIVFPASCAYCRSPLGASRTARLCAACWADFSALAGALCPVCGRPFESPETLADSPTHRCLSCRRDPPSFDQALSVGAFEGSLREAVHQFKYRPCRALGKPLGDWMSERIRVLIGIDAIMPVPLHTSRLRKRGFNQALLLAHRMSLKCSAPLSYDNLVRVRPTRPQVELTGEERIRNVAGAFSLKAPERVVERHVLLIDDVFTTGATLNECAAALKEAGARQVTACTLARAL